MTPSSILLLADPERAARPRELLAGAGYQVSHPASVDDGLHLHAEKGADLVVVVLPLVEASAAGLLRQLRVQDESLVAVVVGGDDTVSGTADALALGAVEHAADESRLLNAVVLAAGTATSHTQLRYLRTKEAATASLELFPARSPRMRAVLESVRQICRRTSRATAPTILISGETGSGKGLLAKAIHYNGARRSHPFVELNCAAIPGTLLEAELFGHERGAFTDARTARPGLLETADGGTLFLDEIACLPLELQAKLLVAIEEKHLRRIGGRQALHVDVQIIAATHRDLAYMVDHGEFRADLFHRLNVLALEIPPLRERGEDILLLADYYVAKLCRDYGQPPRRLGDEARKAMLQYGWPGNVRELRNVLERIILLEDADVITARHLGFGVGRREGVRVSSTGRALQVTIPEDGCPLEQLEREVIKKALELCQGNVSKTARFLSISRQTLMYRLKKFDLQATSD